MQRNCAAVVLAVLLFAAAGCTGAFGAQNGAVEIGTEEGSQGQQYVYVESTGGQLPAGTEIAVEHTLDGVPNASGTLDRSANEGTRVYFGGPLGSASVTDFRHGMPPGTTLVPPDVTVTVTVSVDTGEQTASKTTTFGA